MCVPMSHECRYPQKSEEGGRGCQILWDKSFRQCGFKEAKSGRAETLTAEPSLNPHVHTSNNSSF